MSWFKFIHYFKIQAFKSSENNVMWISKNILCLPTIPPFRCQIMFILYTCFDVCNGKNQWADKYLLSIFLHYHQQKLKKISELKFLCDFYEFQNISGILRFYFENDFIWISKNICFLPQSYPQLGPFWNALLLILDTCFDVCNG